MRIGVFDSGIGGLTVLKKVYEKYPNNEYVYFGDTINLPYGNKDKKELYNLSSKDVEFLISKNVDLIIVACGTVSSNCIDYLKSRYNIPIFDVISPVISYLNNSEYNNIGVIATEATINSGVFRNNVCKNIYEIKTPLFVPLIENDDMEKIDFVIKEYLEEYKNKLDLLVLGCTHCPIIKDRIDHFFGNKVKLLDMGDLLLSNVRDGQKGNINIYYSMLNNKIVDNTKRMLNIEGLDINIKE